MDEVLLETHDEIAITGNSSQNEQMIAKLLIYQSQNSDETTILTIINFDKVSSYNDIIPSYNDKESSLNNKVPSYNDAVSSY